MDIAILEKKYGKEKAENFLKQYEAWCIETQPIIEKIKLSTQRNIDLAKEIENDINNIKEKQAKNKKVEKEEIINIIQKFQNGIIAAIEGLGSTFLIIRVPHIDGNTALKIMGIKKEELSRKNLKKRYKILALKYHPDRKGGNEDKFKEMIQAKEVLEKIL